MSRLLYKEKLASIVGASFLYYENTRRNLVDDFPEQPFIIAVLKDNFRNSLAF